MRIFALTYPQLMNQAIAAGYDALSLAELRRACELAARVADGLYRPNGGPFLCHLLRTGSVVLEERQPLKVVMAALLHATYSLRDHQTHHRWLRNPQQRVGLRQEIGAEVEEIVSAYDGLAWGTRGALRVKLEGLDRLSTTDVQAIVIRLANELEDHLDRGVAYADPGAARVRLETRPEVLALAARLCSDALVAELEEAFAGQLCPPLPAGVVTGRGLAYSHPRTPLGELRWLRSMAHRGLREFRKLRKWLG